MKKLILLLVLNFFVNGCGYYQITGRVKPAIDLNKYDTIFIGWLDLDKEIWASYHYKDQKDWIKLINDVNSTGIHSYYKEVFLFKTIITAKNIDDAPPKDCLYITFKHANFDYKTDTLYVTISCIDSASSRELTHASVAIDAWRGGGWDIYVFERRVMNAIRNLAYFTKEELTL